MQKVINKQREGNSGNDEDLCQWLMCILLSVLSRVMSYRREGAGNPKVEMGQYREGKKESTMEMFLKIAGFTLYLMLILFKPHCA